MATRQTTFADSNTLTAAQLNNEFNEIFTNTTNANIAAGAAIAISKTTLGTFTDWTSWTPTIAVSGGTAPTYTNRFNNYYMQIGKLVIAWGDWSNSSGGTAGSGSNNITVTYPGGIVPAVTSSTLGTGRVLESGGTNRPIMCNYNSSTSFLFSFADGTTNAIGDDQDATVRGVRFILTYQTS